MKSKLLGSAAALALTAATVLATSGPVAARPFHGGWHGGGHGFGWGAGALAAGVIGGAVAAATSPWWGPDYYDYYDYSPGYVYAPAPAPAIGGSVAWCEAHFRSYNPATGTYLGFDGLQHPCP
jgi:BA14K-like protein